MPKLETPPTTSSPTDEAYTLIGSIYLSEQLDLLHLAVINLLDMVTDQEIDLVLEQENKDDRQKKLFIEKLLQSIRCLPLQKLFQDHLEKNDLHFFQERNFGPFLNALHHAANQCTVVKLTVAIEFKEKDVRDLAVLLSKKIGQQVVLNLKVDKSMIGGAIVQHGSYLNDYSLKTQLDMYRSRWHHAVAENQ